MNPDPVEGSPVQGVTAEPMARSIGTVLLALTSLAAAAIHFAETGDHFQEHVSHGLFFSVVAWAQALWAVAILVAPSRSLLMAGVLGNLAVIVTWALSRTSGLPIGPEPWTAEVVGGADLAATAFELAIVVGCGMLLAHPKARSEPVRVARFPVLAAALSLTVLTSAAIATGADHPHSGAGAGAEASGHHDNSDQATGLGGHSHTLAGGSGQPSMFQIELIRRAMKPYRDVDVAVDNGWVKEHADWPEFGSHFYRASDWAASGPARPDLDLADPEFLMYSKRLTGEWKLVAVAYVVDQALYPDPPTNLTGAAYHEHIWNCIVDGEELEEEDWGVISKEECEVMDGRWSPGGVWMTHVWLVNNPYGIFAESNPLLV